MKIKTLVVPAHWASYCLKGEEANLTVHEMTLVKRYLKDNGVKHVLGSKRSEEELIVYVTDENMTPDNYQNAWDNAVRWEEEK